VSGEHGAGEAELAGGPVVVRHRAHEPEPRHALRPAHGELLRHAGAEVVPDHARVVDPEGVEELDDALGVGAQGERESVRPVAAPVAEQVDEEHAVPLGEHAGDARPQVRRRGEAVEQHHGSPPPREPAAYV
jgi:hypothetical protein